MAYVEVECRDESLIAIQCVCGHVIKKRKDSFIPGGHQAICTICGYTDSEIKMQSGETVKVGY
jgi:hypothetical protein